MTVPVLLLSGTCGSGKTTVMHEVSAVLCEREVAHLAVDVDALAQTFPRPADDPFGSLLALENLTAVWANAAARGAQRVVLARVVEEPADVAAIAAAVPGAEVAVVRLVAPAAVVAARLERREQGAGRAWHQRRAVALEAILDRSDVDAVVVPSDGAVRAVAEAALVAAGW